MIHTGRLSKHQRSTSFDDDLHEPPQVKTFNQSSSKRSRKSDVSNSSSMMTSLVSESEDFKAGDFVVLSDEIGKENMHIWK